MRTTWTFGSAGQLLFGPYAVQQLGDLAQRLALHPLLVVTDRKLAQAGVLDQVLRPLQAAGVAVEVFDAGAPEPAFPLAQETVEAARAANAVALLGLGGGSNMDLAKMASVLLAHGGSPSDYAGENRVPGPVAPVICVPTTAGTGSEISASCVMTDDASQLKIGVLSHFMRPRLAVVDPCLALTCPRKVTADSGIDALVHAIEAFTAMDNDRFLLPPGESTIYQGRNPLGDLFAAKAISLIGQHLVRAVRQGDDLDARAGMALAATLAGLAFSNVGVALTHALEYPIGGAVHCSHGEGNGVLLPHVMRFNLPGREAEFARVAELLGRSTAGLPLAAAAEQAIDAVQQISRDIGLPSGLSRLGVQPDQIDLLAEKALSIKRILRVNPRQPTLADLRQILRQAL